MLCYVVIGPTARLLGIWSCGCDAAEQSKKFEGSTVHERQLNSGVEACTHIFERQPRSYGEPVLCTCKFCGAYQ